MITTVTRIRPQVVVVWIISKTRSEMVNYINITHLSSLVW